MENDDQVFKTSPGFVPLNSPQGRDRLRGDLLAALPRAYSPWLHLLGPSAVGVCAAIACLVRVDGLRAIELTVIPVLFLSANAFEWRLHKSFMHRPRWPFRLLYEQHTLMHHRLYVEDDMALRSFREAAFVLFPWFAVPLVIVGTSPIAAALWFFVTPNTGLLFSVSCVSYVLLYEWSHLSFHLARESTVGRLALVRALARHHARHHDPRLMSAWNMNVVIPLWDYVRHSAQRVGRPTSTKANQSAEVS